MHIQNCVSTICETAKAGISSFRGILFINTFRVWIIEEEVCVYYTHLFTGIPSYFMIISVLLCNSETMQLCVESRRWRRRDQEFKVILCYITPTKFKFLCGVPRIKLGVSCGFGKLILILSYIPALVFDF